MRIDMIGWIATLGLVTALASACGPSDTTDASALVERSPDYGPNSWRELIAPDCRSFFDGCSRCQREPGGCASTARDPGHIAARA